jgi:hypothetical protein
MNFMSILGHSDKKDQKIQYGSISKICNPIVK